MDEQRPARANQLSFTCNAVASWIRHIYNLKPNIKLLNVIRVLPCNYLVTTSRNHLVSGPVLFLKLKSLDGLEEAG